jgi:hypothetical protein
MIAHQWQPQLITCVYRTEEKKWKQKGYIAAELM